MQTGFDLSSHQGAVRWERVKADFAMIRAGWSWYQGGMNSVYRPAVYRKRRGGAGGGDSLGDLPLRLRQDAGGGGTVGGTAGGAAGGLPAALSGGIRL